MRLRLPLLLAGGAVSLTAMLAACVVLLALGLAHYGVGLVIDLPTSSPTPEYLPSTEAERDIPPLYLHLYEAAAARFGIDWTVLAGIGTVECDNGRDPAPSCSVPGALNYAGAGGPAQFLVSTWKRYGITPSGQGTPNMWNPADAIFSMANYLHAAGAPADYPRAIFAYNHAWWYVDEVLSWARRYRAAYGDRATDGHRPTASLR
jgi:membrane-bound lytic murein transglycosylase B